MSKRTLVTLALALCVTVGLAALSGLRQEEKLFEWHKSLAQGGLNFEYSGMGGKPTLCTDTMYLAAHTASAIIETLDLEIPLYYPVIWADNATMGFSVYFPYTIGTGAGVTGIIPVAYPDSAIVTIPGGPVNQLIFTRPTGDTATAFTLYVQGYPGVPTTAKLKNY